MVAEQKSLARFEIWRPVPSLNVWERMYYKKKHAIRQAFFEEVGLRIILREIRPIDAAEFPIRLRFTQLLGRGCRKYDSSNWSVAAKIIEDAFVHHQIIPDDRRKYVKLFVENDPEEHRKKLCGGVRVEVEKV